jgi:virginiamycin B lyase
MFDLKNAVENDRILTSLFSELYGTTATPQMPDFRSSGRVSDPSGIIAGPDGAMWFTEENGNKIGRITTAGDLSEYPIPTTNSEPVNITAGPDGALWFTELNGNKIRRVFLSLSQPTLSA